MLGCSAAVPYPPQDGGGVYVPEGTTTFNVEILDNAYYGVNGLINPFLTLKRGQTYTFNINAAGNPFYIMSAGGVNLSFVYSDGVTGNGTDSGTLTFTVPTTAPDVLFYDCSAHLSMGGRILITN